MTADEWAAVHPPFRRGRPPSVARKVSTTIRLDADLLAVLKASGPGWQTRINDAVRALFMKQPAA